MVQDPVAIDWDIEGACGWSKCPASWRTSLARTNTIRSAAWSCSRTPTATARWTSGRCLPTAWCLARSVKVLDLGVLVAEPPNLWLMRDTNGDLRADTKELVSDRFGTRDGDPQNARTAFRGRSTTGCTPPVRRTLQFRLKNRTFELEKTLARGEWGVTEDDAGRIYRNTNESALHVDLVPTVYFARNPHLLRTRGSYERLADDDDPS